MSNNGQLKKMWTQGEELRIQAYYRKFVEIYERYKGPGATAGEMQRILNVQIHSFQARWPDEAHLCNEAVHRFTKDLKRSKKKKKGKRR